MIEEESQQTIECKAAIRAALEKVGEYCGLGEMGKPEQDGPAIRIPGLIDVPMKWIPEDIFRIIDESGTSEGAINKLIEHEWVISQAFKSRHHALSDDAPEELKEGYLKYTKRKIAETLYWSRVKGTLETAEERAAREEQRV